MEDCAIKIPWKSCYGKDEKGCDISTYKTFFWLRCFVHDEKNNVQMLRYLRRYRNSLFKRRSSAQKNVFSSIWVFLALNFRLDRTIFNWVSKSTIALVLLNFAQWLARKTRAILWTNQMRLGHPRFPALRLFAFFHFEFSLANNNVLLSYNYDLKKQEKKSSPPSGESSWIFPPKTMPLNNTKMKNFARIDILSNYWEKDRFSKQLVSPYMNTKRKTDGLA